MGYPIPLSPLRAALRVFLSASLLRCRRVFLPTPRAPFAAPHSNFGPAPAAVPLAFSPRRATETACRGRMSPPLLSGDLPATAALLLGAPSSTAAGMASAALFFRGGTSVTALEGVVLSLRALGVHVQLGILASTVKPLLPRLFFCSRTRSAVAPDAHHTLFSYSVSPGCAPLQRGFRHPLRDAASLGLGVEVGALTSRPWVAVSPLQLATAPLCPLRRLPHAVDPGCPSH